MQVKLTNIFIKSVLIPILLFKIGLFAQEIEFKHLTVDNGLSNNKVNCVLQDRSGFIWIGTEDGLNRFDGYEIKIFRHQPENNNSISDNTIWALFEDKDSSLWIGTKSGEINYYNPKTDKFKSWKVVSKNTNENSITCVFRDKDGMLWIGSYKNGLYRFDVKTNTFLNWQHRAGDKNSLSNNYVTSVLQDSKGNFWISTYNGLNKFNPRVSQSSFTKYYHDSKDTSVIGSNLIWNIFNSHFEQNTFWICNAGGLNYYNSDSNSFSNLTFPYDKELQFGNSVGSMIEDRSDGRRVYWIGTYSGLLEYDLINNISNRFFYRENIPHSLTSNQINSMIEDRSGVIWIGTENGVNYFSTKKQKFNYSLSNNSKHNNFDALQNSNVTAICNSDDASIWVGTPSGLSLIKYKGQKEFLESSLKFSKLNVWTLNKGNSNILWIGTYGQGLKELNIKTNAVKSIDIKSEFQMPSLFRYVKSIMQDKDGKVWIGYWGSGLVRYNPVKKEFKVWINDENDLHSLSYNDVWVIYEDSRGRIWIGTNGGGLNLYNKEKQNFFRLLHESQKKNGLSSNSIFSICENNKFKFKSNENQTVLWVGTSYGLNKVTINDLDFVNNENQLNVNIRIYTVKDGLPDNSVKSIVQDNDGKLWLGTSNGLSEFNPITEKFVNYSKSNGLNGNDFNFSAGLITKEGLIFLGGTSGMNIFNPSQIVQSSYTPPIQITDFQLFNESIKVGDDSPLKTDISFADEINLSYDQNIFAFQFSALDYNSSKSIHYAYKLEGVDKDWINSGTRRYAAYTNLNPGEYTFLVKGTNSDGVWSDKFKALKITINSPWWKTGWAYFFYLLLIFLGLVGIRRFEKNVMKLRNELKMREFESKKHQEVEMVKSRFFANLSHEFRTPLMLIKGPVEQLRNGQIKDNPEKYYDLIFRNAENLHTLIDELLELTQLEAQAIPIRARKQNLVSIVRGIFYSFESVAIQKNISIKFISDDKSVFAWIDRDKLEKIINNLLSNSFKFTPQGGKVTLSVKTLNSDLKEFSEIKISDSGIGIPEDKLNRIFDRFYQVDDSLDRAYGGSGIGLSLVKELVDLHKWKIYVQSQIDEGTTFILIIPLSESYLLDKQKVREDTKNENAKEAETEVLIDNNYPIEDSILHKPKKNISDQIKIENNKASILIVEDSHDVRDYIFSLLQNEYNIFQAENANEGLIKAKEMMPDLILSDIMMPGVDGLEFCKQIKTNFQTSHIPIILLTAKVSEENKIEGLETGADDYVAKPFSFRELSARIKNLLEQRKQLRERFLKELNIQPSEITINSLDKEFLEKALKIVEHNILNLDFDLEMFAKEMFLSRSQLHRKMIAITGQAPGEFLRIFRLKKAAKLILERKLSITQIALEVGFSSPSHFTKAFQQYFNCSPSDYISVNIPSK
jgi:ligand-binding sensor domain-containing protein/signal transduction histidine kinase/DNA-binding response OmpR family regulator